MNSEYLNFLAELDGKITNNSITQSDSSNTLLRSSISSDNLTINNNISTTTSISSVPIKPTVIVSNKVLTGLEEPPLCGYVSNTQLTGFKPINNVNTPYAPPTQLYSNYSTYPNYIQPVIPTTLPNNYIHPTTNMNIPSTYTMYPTNCPQIPINPYTPIINNNNIKNIGTYTYPSIYQPSQQQQSK